MSRPLLHYACTTLRCMLLKHSIRNNTILSVNKDRPSILETSVDTWADPALWAINRLCIHSRHICKLGGAGCRYFPLGPPLPFSHRESPPLGQCQNLLLGTEVYACDSEPLAHSCYLTADRLVTEPVLQVHQYATSQSPCRERGTITVDKRVIWIYCYLNAGNFVDNLIV